MNHPALHWLRRLVCSAPLVLLLSTCSSEDDTNAACQSLCSDLCQTLPGCGLEVPANCTAECVSGLGDSDCSEARPVGQLTCGEQRELYACSEYCAAFCTSAAACAPFDERLCVIGCASEPLLCNARSVAARDCEQLKPEARLYEDLGRAQQSGTDDVFVVGGSLAQFGLCQAPDECDAPLGCSVETNTCEACVSDDECARGLIRPWVCAEQGRCLEVECATDDDCFRGLCDTESHTCIDCMRDEDCAAGVSASYQPACDVGTNQCVECIRDEHCAMSALASLLPACNVGGQRCVECTRDEHCSSSRPRCNAGDFSCVECVTNADCPGEAPQCDTQLHFCSPQL